MAGVGRPRLCSDHLLRKVLAMRAKGMSYQQISDALNAEGVATPAGGSHWGRTYVARLVYTRSAREMPLA